MKALLTKIIMFMPILAMASGFPVGRKKTALYPYLGYYTATAYKDFDNNKISFANDGRFSQVYLQLYGEHGLSDRVDLTFKVPFVFNRYNQTGFTSPNLNNSLSDTELGLKYVAGNFDGKSYLSLQGSAIVPLYENKSQPFAGYGQWGAEAKLMYSGSAQKETNNSYYNIEAGFRRYFGDNAGNVNQINYLATMGFFLGKNHVLSGEISGVHSLEQKNAFIPSNPTFNTHFTFVKATFSYGTRVGGDNWIYAGIFHDVLNRNSGIGQGVSISGAIRF